MELRLASSFELAAEKYVLGDQGADNNLGMAQQWRDLIAKVGCPYDFLREATRERGNRMTAFLLLVSGQPEGHHFKSCSKVTSYNQSTRY